jgi:hypothetical protein
MFFISFYSCGDRGEPLEDKIRDLCSKLVSDADNHEMTETARLLNCALQEHVRRMRERMSTCPPPIERRMQSGE